MAEPTPDFQSLAISWLKTISLAGMAVAVFFDTAWTDSNRYLFSMGVLIGLLLPDAVQFVVQWLKCKFL